MSDVQFWVAIGVQVAVGLGVFMVWRVQSGLLDKYKDLLSVTDPTKMKAQMENFEKATDMKHRMLMAGELDKITEDAFKVGRLADKEFDNRYNELMRFVVFQIGILDKPKREEALSMFPVCADVIRKHVHQFDKDESSERDPR